MLYPRGIKKIMNFRAEKRLEAERLRERMIETNMFGFVGVHQKRNSFFTTFDISSQHYYFPITRKFLKKTELERTAEFDRFVADAILHASQMRALQLVMEKNIKRGDINGEEKPADTRTP